MNGTCDSCGHDDELLRVVRLYVTPGGHDQPNVTTEAGEEGWCFACRTHYAHREVAATDPSV